MGWTEPEVRNQELVAIAFIVKCIYTPYEINKLLFIIYPMVLKQLNITLSNKEKQCSLVNGTTYVAKMDTTGTYLSHKFIILYNINKQFQNLRKWINPELSPVSDREVNLVGTLGGQNVRKNPKKSNRKTGIFTQNQFSTKSIFLYGCNSKTNDCKYLKCLPNVYTDKSSPFRILGERELCSLSFFDRTTYFVYLLFLTK
ncbi:hypothetical protein AGLY_009862 [Aphis glycines]|uniref:Uncharacterized protein n=1 Tax=Aphis glycines TaxID=307491 RepID=A0A6G0TH49_APHGL|nr:hypothetical protein AGLY_009862 [Aphis glycines]